MKEIELPIEEIIEKYENGIIQSELAKQYGVTQPLISKRIREYYKETGKQQPKRIYHKKELPKEEIAKKHKEGIILIKLAEEYAVSENTISKVLRDYYKETGEERPKLQKTSGRKAKELPMEDIVKKYEKGILQIELAEEYGVTCETISKRIKKYCEEMGRERPKRKSISRKTKRLPIEDIIKKYENGISQTELAKEYGVSHMIIRGRITEYYELIGKTKPSNKRGAKKKKLPIEDIIKKYENGITIKKLTEEFGVSNTTISNKINEYYERRGQKRVKHKNSGRKSKELPIEDIIKKIEDGVSKTKLAIEYNISDASLYRRIKKYYEEKDIETSTRHNTLKKLPVEEIIKKNEDGITIKMIAQRYNVSPTTISKIIREYYENAGKELPNHKIKELPIQDIIKKYEDGITETQLSKEYNVAEPTIKRKITEYYQNEKKRKPRRLRSIATIIEYLEKGLTIEQILEIADEKNVIIPKDIIENALRKIEKGDLSKEVEERE